MAVRRRPEQSLGDLNMAVVDLILDGKLRSPQEVIEMERRGIAYDQFVEFDDPGPDLSAIWNTHRAALLAEWERRGGKGQPWIVVMQAETPCRGDV